MKFVMFFVAAATALGALPAPASAAKAKAGGVQVTSKPCLRGPGAKARAERAGPDVTACRRGSGGRLR